MSWTVAAVAATQKAAESKPDPKNANDPRYPGGGNVGDFNGDWSLPPEPEPEPETEWPPAVPKNCKGAVPCPANKALSECKSTEWCVYCEWQFLPGGSNSKAKEPPDGPRDRYGRPAPPGPDPRDVYQLKVSLDVGAAAAGNVDAADPCDELLAAARAQIAPKASECRDKANVAAGMMRAAFGSAASGHAGRSRLGRLIGSLGGDVGSPDAAAAAEGVGIADGDGVHCFTVLRRAAEAAGEPQSSASLRPGARGEVKHFTPSPGEFERRRGRAGTSRVCRRWGRRWRRR